MKPYRTHTDTCHLRLKKMSFLIDATWFKNMVSRKWHAKKAYDAQKNCLVIFELKNAFKKRIHF